MVRQDCHFPAVKQLVHVFTTKILFLSKIITKGREMSVNSGIFTVQYNFKSISCEESHTYSWSFCPF